MTITTTALARAAGVAAATSGLLYGLIQLVHPEETVAAVQSARWALVGAMTIAMAVLGLVGVTGLYLRHVRQVRVLGLAGAASLGAFYLVTTMFTFAETFVFPELVHDAPRVVEELNAIFAGGSTGDLGAITRVNPVAFVLYFGGGIALGLALLRARVLARWASALLVAGTVLTLAVPLVPHSLARMAALPEAAAMVGLGISLWREARSGTGGTASSTSVRREQLATR